MAQEISREDAIRFATDRRLITANLPDNFHAAVLLICKRARAADAVMGRPRAYRNWVEPLPVPYRDMTGRSFARDEEHE